MHIYRQLLVLLAFATLLTGCDQQAMFEKLIPKKEAAFARQIYLQLAAKDYASIEKQLDPKAQAPSARAVLEQMAAIFPAEEPKSINTVASNRSTVNAVTTYNLKFEYEYSGVWLLADVVLQRSGDQLTILGLHVNPMKQSLKAVNRFTFEGKSPVQYIIFVLAVVVPLFIVCVLVLCIRTPIAKRKWLWLVFVAIGFVQLSVNWTDGSYGIQPLSFALLGAGFFRAGPYAPFILNVAIPIGAIVFLVKRRSLLAQNAG